MSDAAPKTRRRRNRAPQPVFFAPGQEDDLDPTPLERVAAADEEGVADTVAEMLQALRGVTTDDAKIMIYRGDYRGKWEFLTTMWPPINADTLLDDIQQKFGGGSYNLRVYAAGKIVTTKQIVIGGKPKTVRNPEEEPENKDSDKLTELLLSQANQSKTDLLAMMTMMSKSSQDNQALMMTIMQQSQAQMMQMMTVLIPAMTGGRDTPASIMSAMAPFLQQSKPEDTVKLFASIKELVGDSGGGGEKSMLETAAAGLLPLLGKLGEASQQPGGAPQPYPQPMPAIATGYSELPPGYRMPQEYSGPPVIDPAQGDPLAPPVDAATRLIRQFGPDVIFYAARGLPPGLAAEGVVTTLDNIGVSDEDVTALVVRFTTSPDWITDLKSFGYDLTTRREWANQFLAELVREYTARHTSDGNTGRSQGGT